jgi:cyclopropane-fatty-acyl-phospholipid synthase
MSSEAFLVVDRGVKEARMRVADVMATLVTAGLGGSASVRLTCWDGSELGPPDAPVQLTITSPHALRRLLWAPNQLGFARAYVSGDILIGGDLLGALSVLEQVADPEFGPGVVIVGSTGGQSSQRPCAWGSSACRHDLRLRSRSWAGCANRRIAQPRPSPTTTTSATSYYERVLGQTMAYSCAYHDQEPGAAFGLDEAQLAKCDLVSRKLGLEPGMRVLDVGCGWGAFVCNAARQYGVEAVGITLSREQADYARRRAVEEGVGDRVEIRVQDYRDVDDGPYDAIASIGMAEHVGQAMLPTTRRTCSHC